MHDLVVHAIAAVTMAIFAGYYGPLIRQERQAFARRLEDWVFQRENAARQRGISTDLNRPSADRQDPPLLLAPSSLHLYADNVVCL